MTAEAGDGFVRLSWDDVAERGVGSGHRRARLRGLPHLPLDRPRVPRPAGDHRPAPARGPIGNGKPIAQFDLIDGKRGFSGQDVEGVAYYLGEDTGHHPHLDRHQVTNGQLYFYAVTAYDFGSERPIRSFYPSENAIAVSRTPRGGLDPAGERGRVRPNPRAAGLVPAAAAGCTRSRAAAWGPVGGRGRELEPGARRPRLQDHVRRPVARQSFAPTTYALIDARPRRDALHTRPGLRRAGHRPGRRRAPARSSPPTRRCRSIARALGLRTGSPTERRLTSPYQPGLPDQPAAAPVFPTTSRSCSPTRSWTPCSRSSRSPALPAKFKVFAHPPSGDLRARLRSATSTATARSVSARRVHRASLDLHRRAPDLRVAVTWRVELDTAGQGPRGPLRPPAPGDVFEIGFDAAVRRRRRLHVPHHGRAHRSCAAAAEFPKTPTSCPIPTSASASFEPERFAVRAAASAGSSSAAAARMHDPHLHGARRSRADARHDGSTDGFVPWNLRTKDNLDVAPGLYVFHVDGAGLGSHIGKFAMIK